MKEIVTILGHKNLETTQKYLDSYLDVIETGKILKTFKKIYPDKKKDPTYFYHQKNIKHPLIKGLHIIVDYNSITVYGIEPLNKVNKAKNGDGTHYVIMFKAKTTENLKHILQLIKI